MTNAEIDTFGERYATAWLSANGFNHHRDAKQAASTDITATKGIVTCLVQVKTEVLFGTPPTSPNFPSKERRDIASRATRLGYEAWAALVVINIRGGLVGKISWEKLN
jgi:hypothetical protein